MTAAPGPVTALAATNIGTETLTLTWVNPADLDLAGIIIRRAEGDEAPETTGDGDEVVVEGTAETVDDTGLTANTVYTYAVWTTDEDPQNSATSTTLTICTAQGAPHSATLYTDPSWSTPAETEAANELETRASRAGYSFEFEATKEAYQRLTGLQIGDDPFITGIIPASGWITRAKTDVEITVAGENFLDTSSIEWDGEVLETTFVSATELTAIAPGSDEAAEVQVGVINGDWSRSKDAFPFEFITVPTPVLTSLDPASAQANDQDVEITVTGENFIDLSVVNFDGVELETTVVSDTELTAIVAGADAADMVDVFVDNTEDETSEIVGFEFTVDDLPTITSLTPSTHLIGAAPFSVTVAGTNFIDDVSVVNWDGVDLETTFVDVDELTVTAPASAEADTVNVVVSNGGAIVSGTHTFTYTAE